MQTSKRLSESVGKAMRNLRVLYAILAIAALMGVACVSGVSMYVGARMQATRNDQEVAQLRADIAAQKLDYEKRLGTQSARYALDATNFGKAVDSFGLALAAMERKNDQRAEERQRAQAQAIAAAQRAAQTAAETAQKTTQILKSQEVVQQQVSESVAAAKATEKKLDRATLPAALVPAHPWSGAGRN